MTVHRMYFCAGSTDCSTNAICLPVLSDLMLSKNSAAAMETSGFEPLTPCLQGRCSPS